MFLFESRGKREKKRAPRYFGAPEPTKGALARSQRPKMDHKSWPESGFRPAKRPELNPFRFCHDRYLPGFQPFKVSIQ